MKWGAEEGHSQTALRVCYLKGVPLKMRIPRSRSVGAGGPARMFIQGARKPPRSLAISIGMAVMAAEGGIVSEWVRMRAERGIP